MNQPTAHATEPSRQPLTECPGCHASLCEHLVCRVCGDCPECDGRFRHAMGARPAPVVTPRGVTAATPADHRERRLRYLLSQGIAEADLDDADRALCELRGDCCACKRRKLRNQSFCLPCFKSLPSDLQAKLYLHFRHGYLEHIRRAWELLRRAGRIA